MLSNAVEVKNLTFAYSGMAPLLRSVSFSICKGEMLVIAGQSGCGKTTLCRIICGIIPHSIKGTLDGEIAVMGIAPSSVSLPQNALNIGMVFQDPDSQIICTTVEDELAFGLENFCKPPNEIRRRVDELLAEFGFESLRYANPELLSGGQKKLLTIAAVLATSPPILILDEPMSGLDRRGRSLVTEAVEQQRLQGRTVIIIEHDLKTAECADRWLLLHDGAVAAHGAPSEITKDRSMLEGLGVWA